MTLRWSHKAAIRRKATAFTLVEVIVSITVLLLIMVGVTTLFSGVVASTGLGTKHMDTDGQARAVFDRMDVDFTQMFRRPDVDYYLKGSTNPQPGNDQLAFYSQVPGYYPAAYATAGVQSPVSLVAYRLNADSGSTAFNKLQRMGCGLLWNGVSTTDASVVFSAAPTSLLPNTISQMWPAAVDKITADSRYELASAQVFRFEYSYLLRGQILPNGTVLTPTASDTPWDTRITGITNVPDHTAVQGLRDVSAIVVTIALIDPKSRVLVTDGQLATLAGGMADDSASMQPGDLVRQWQSQVLSSNLPRPAADGIRIYQRSFFLPLIPVP